MKPSRTLSRLFLIVALAGVGFLMIYVPTWIVQNYSLVSQMGEVWARLYLAVVGIGATLLFGTSAWICWRIWRSTSRKQKRRRRRGKNPSELTPAEKEAELDQNLAAVGELQSDTFVSDDLRGQLTPLVQRLRLKREKQRLEIVAFGTISSGKSSLLNALAGQDVFATDTRGGTTVRRADIPWPGADEVILVDTPGLGEVDGVERQGVAGDAAENADLVLVVVDGPLRHSEFSLLELLAKMEKRVLVCLNKQDWYTSAERDELLDQISEQVSQFVAREDVVAVHSQPAYRSRVRILSNGEEVEEKVEVPPDIRPLAHRMLQIIKRDGRDLLMANLLLQSRGLVDDAKTRVKDALDKRAWGIVDKYTWGSAGAAALSPFPVVDLAAGCAISTKMVLDLAQVYKQDIDINVAINLLGQQGKNLLGVLGTSVATPMVTSAVASLIKTVPGVGTIAGGLLQGVVQAVICRWIGGIFIHYYKNEMQEPPGGLAALARKQWQHVTSVAELRKLVQAAREHFRDDSEEDEADE